ncbi:UDP-N-acetylmuramate--L-alanine ligase [Intestinibacillus massiliensis]|uniref:UDP-N-acetylmuramate--L-alanine ligase n=1 Tax=Intestinibacillus massiliensis TaxID=1871029 RepID=UPI000B361E13|nr:UDP-N-acetylmuramate--L-alanine ligase [Intestinibacillus massiliensis]
MNHILSIKPYIENHNVIHLIGIGGVSMNSLAELLLSLGARVTGSDRQETAVTERLERLGARITYAHQPENVEGAALIIRTSAIHDENPEIVRANQLSIPVVERAAAWGCLMADYDNVICLSGTHGKTTTTSMMAMITMQAGLDPTVMVGSQLPAIGGTLRIGEKGYFVAESCEYCNSFLNFCPTVAAILNVEADHLDFFKDIDDIIHSFHEFCLLTPENGAVVVNADDENAMRAVQGVGRETITFGTGAGAHVRPEHISIRNGYYSFDVMAGGEMFTSVTLSVPGYHNMMNALACCAISLFLKIDPEQVRLGLAAFTGSSRRFQLTGRMASGAVVVDDYAHHPSEMRATLSAARQMDFSRIICAFQPHTYTRTKALFNEFVEALGMCDQAVLAPIYAAREKNTVGISSADLAAKIEGAVSLGTFEEIAAYLRSIAREGDLILTMGAGDIDRVGRLLVEEGKI